MAEYSKSNINGIPYDIKDAKAREKMAELGERQKVTEEIVKGLTTLPPGSSGATDAEVVAARVDGAGITYDNLGEAMRAQVPKSAIVHDMGENPNFVISQKAVSSIIKRFNKTTEDELKEYVKYILECLEKVAWAVPDGQKYYYKLYSLLNAKTVQSNILTIYDDSLKSGFISDDGSVNTTTDAGINFYWDSFVKAHAFALLDENNVGTLDTGAVYRYAAYDEDYNFISRGYETVYGNALFLTDISSPYYKLGFKNGGDYGDYVVNKALIAPTKVNSLCTIANTTLNAQGEIEEYAGRISSEYFKVYDNTPILFASKFETAIICIYDKDLTLLDRKVNTLDDIYTKIIRIPEGAKYCRVCTTPSSEVYISLELQD